MYKKTNGTLSWLEFELLSQFPNIKHFVITAQNNFDATNPSSTLSLNLPQITAPTQVHGNSYHIIETASPPTKCDALITSSPNTPLMIKHADCQATILYDPTNNTIANIHSGWKGSSLNIYKNVIATMQKRFNSNPQHIIACVSPSIGPHNYQFKDWKTLLPENMHKYRMGEDHFDFWSIAEDQLVEAGLLPENIEIAKICTYENPEFYSYRLNKTTKRNATIVGRESLDINSEKMP